MIRKLITVILIAVLISSDYRLTFVPYVVALLAVWCESSLPMRLWSRIIAYLPLLLSILVERPYFSINVWEITLNTSLGFLLLSIYIKDLKIIFSKLSRELLPRISSTTFYYETIFIYSSAVIEEIFFKGFMLHRLSFLGIVSVLITAFLFTFLHWINVKPMRKREYIAQFVMMSGTGLLFYFTGSIIGCILCHCVYSTPFVVKLYFQSQRQ